MEGYPLRVFKMMNKKFIRENYNIDKIITAQELVKLSKSYKDNEEKIIVSMTRKHKNPQQPPE
ncbi:MAG: hypothetical protein MJ223_04110 [Mycoplasmoidaceae bacterium]|nr:hypothetical protein [Mycoplasmoidaceae bacterium]